MRAIRDVLARRNPGYAEALAGRVVARTASLDGMPLMGSEVREYGDPAVREVVEYPYRILYRVDGTEIVVVGISHPSRRLPRTPPG